MAMEPLHIVYATDEKYLLPTQVALSSAVYNASRKKDLVIDILECGISDAKWLSFESGIRRSIGYEFALVRHKTNCLAYRRYKSWHSSWTAYARFEIPDILPSNVAWCVYADSDTLFVADPFELQKIYDDKWAIMGHRDVDGMIQASWFAKNGFAWKPDEYVCSGFLLLNLNMFRCSSMSQKLRKFLSAYPDVPFPDQDALNIVCRGEVGVLPTGWGVFANDVFNVCDEPYCIHFVGEHPWEWPALGLIGMPDTSRLWFAYSGKVCKLRLNRCRYLFRYCYSRIMKVMFRTLCRFPRLRLRYSVANSRFASRKIWKHLSRKVNFNPDAHD